MRALTELPASSEEVVVDLLTRLGLAGDRTRDEHDRLPEVSWDALVANPWARYAGVEVVDTWAEATVRGAESVVVRALHGGSQP